jgi:hypothetical protein
VVGRAATILRNDKREVRVLEIRIGDIGIEEADWIVFGNIVFDGIRHEYKLVAIGSLDMIHGLSVSMKGFCHI